METDPNVNKHIEGNPQIPNGVQPENNPDSPNPPPTNAKFQNNQKLRLPKYFIPLIVILIVLLGLLTTFLVVTKSKRQTPNQAIISKNIPTARNQTPTPTLPPFPYDANLNYTVVLKQNPNCKSLDYDTYCLADVYLKDSETGESTFFMTINNVQHDSRDPKFVNGKLFLIKRIVEPAPSQDTIRTNLENTNWTDELWTYSIDRTDTKLYSMRGVVFSVNTDATLVAVDEVGNPIDPEKIRVIPTNPNQTPTDYKISSELCIPDPSTREVVGTIGLRGWNKSGKDIWGDYSGEFAVVGCFWQVNTTTGKIAYYPVPSSLGGMSALNTEKKVAIYQDFPPFVDKDTYDSWVNNHPTYSIYLYDLTTQTSTKIDTFPSSFPGALVYVHWTSDSTLSYQSPNGAKTYTIP